MKSFRVIFFCPVLLASPAKAEGERAAWIAERQKMIQDAKADPGPKSMESLGLIIRGLGRQVELADDTRAIYDDARETLMSYPGYADYFGGEIKRLTDAELSLTSTEHRDKRSWDAETLAYLPSPESVKVLGELLFDERDPFQGNGSDAPWEATCFYAEDALVKMGIKNAPAEDNQFSVLRDDLPKWQQWYKEVKSGKVTLSFKGDDKVYNLDGPVDAPPSPSRTRAAPAATTPPVASAPPSRPFWPLAIVLSLVAGGVYAVIRRSGKAKVH